MSRVIHSKLVAPHPLGDLLERAALVERALASAALRVVLIQAPAGYGKTTLLQQIRARLVADGVNTGWLTLDESDDDPSRFLVHLHAVIDQALRERGDATGQDSQPGSAAPGYGMVEELLNHVAMVGRRLAILIDEFQILHAEANLSLMRRLVAQIPAGLTFFIASRSVPALGLSRLLLRNEALILRTEDLGFTRAETADFFAATDDAVDATLLEELHLRTEGWPAALQLARLAAAGQYSHRALEDLWFADAGLLEEYLADNVLSAQPEALQSFLLRISLLRRVHPALAAELTGVATADQVLDELARAGYFLRPLTDARGWFKLHSLFATYLERQLTRREPETISALHGRALDWYRAHDEAEEAMHHAVASRRFDHAAEILETWSDQLVREARLATIERWLDELPQAEVLARPSLQIRVLWALMFLRRTDKIRPLFEALIAAIERGALPSTTRATMPLLRAIRLMVEDDIAGAGAIAMSIAVEREPDNAFEAFELAAAANVQAFHLRAVGSFTEAHAKLPVALRASARAESVFSGAYALANAGTVLLAEARLREALARYAEGYAMTAALRGSHAAAVVAACYAEALYYDDALREARALLDDAMPLIRDACLVDALAVAHVTLSKLLLDDGDAAGATAVLHEAEAIGTRAGLPRVARIVGWEVVRQAIVTNQLPRARAVADALLAAAPDGVAGVVFHAEETDDAVIGSLRLALHEGRAQEVLRALKPPAREAARGGRRLRALRLNMLEALALQATGEISAALRVTADLLVRSGAEGLSRFVLEEPGLAALVAQVRAQQGALADSGAAPDPAYLERLLARVRELPSTNDASGAGAGASLSEREADILIMLIQGLSNRDIGTKIFVSENTVKYHLKNIYAKLGVKNRMEACNVALARGLLRV